MSMKKHTFTIRVQSCETREAVYWKLLGMMAARQPDGLKLNLLKQHRNDALGCLNHAILAIECEEGNSAPRRKCWQKWRKAAGLESK